MTAIPAASSPCTGKFHYSWGQPLNLYIPDGMAYGFAAVIGGPAAVTAFLFSEIGPLEWAAAASIAGAILSANALLAAWAGCDIFGPGNGVRFSWTWTGGSVAVQAIQHSAAGNPQVTRRRVPGFPVRSQEAGSAAKQG